jgi:hypothetical protein
MERSVIALVLGGAASLWDDIESASALVDPADCLIVATNDAGVHWPHRLDHWATMHATEMEHRVRQRAKLGHPPGFVTWTRPYPAGMKEREAMCDRVLSGWNGGSSGLLATGIAIEHGCSVILCGVPLDVRPHFNRVGPWTSAADYRAGWLERYSVLASRVRSFGGWTADVFGAPTRKWLDAIRTAGVA